MLRHVECLELFVTSALTRVYQISNLLFLLIIVFSTAIEGNEVLQSQVTATDSNDNCLTLDLHEDLLPCEPVDTWGLPLEVHLGAESQRGFIDVRGKVLVDRVVTHWLVEEKFVFDAALHVFHLDLKSFNLFVFHLASAHELHSDRLRLLEPLLDV